MQRLKKSYSTVPLSVLCGHKILLFSEKREELVQTSRDILDDRLIVENRSRAGLQGGYEADSDDRKTEQLHHVA